MVFFVLGNYLKVMDFQNSLKILLCFYGEILYKGNMICILDSGYYFVVRGMLVLFYYFLEL